MHISTVIFSNFNSNIRFKLGLFNTCMAYCFQNNKYKRNVRKEWNYENLYLRHILIRLADFRWDGRFEFENVCVNILSIQILNIYEQFTGMGLGCFFIDYIKVNKNTLNNFKWVNSIEYINNVVDGKQCCPKYIISWETMFSSSSKECGRD